MPRTPEDKAREAIDALLAQAGWIVQNRKDANIDAGPGIAVREFSLGQSHGEADYLLFVNAQAVGAIEAKREGATLIGVEKQTFFLPVPGSDDRSYSGNLLPVGRHRQS